MRKLLYATQEELRIAQAALVQQTQKARFGRLTTTLVHDLHHLLALIRGDAKVRLQSVPLESSGHGDAMMLQAQLARATALVQSIVDFSQQSTPPAE